MNVSRNSIVSNRISHRRHRPDYWLVILSLIMLGVGLVVVYGISPGLNAKSGAIQNYYIGKQSIAVLLGVVAFLITANLPIHRWRNLQKPLIISSIIAVAAVFLLGQQVNGAHRWLQIGGISFQGVELVKLTLIVWLAGFLTDKVRKNELLDKNRSIKPLLYVFGGLAVIVAGLQSDLGSFGVVIAIGLTMIYVVGMPMRKLALAALVVIIGGTLLIGSSGYRRERFQTFLNPTKDCQNTGYQACQALITVGSGGIFGLGVAKSVQAYGYLPEAADDSIFAILAEKFGFIGVSVLLGLFVTLFARLKRILDKAPDDYSRLLVTGILAWLSTQMIINVGAMIGLLPLKGITLPFISYGGTSVVFVTAAIGMAFQVSRYTTYGSPSNEMGRKNNDNSIDRRGFRGAYHPNPSSR